MVQRKQEDAADGKRIQEEGMRKRELGRAK
jgi:hypothetical protein